MCRTLWLTFGYVALALAGLGVPLPILPTTPFVILAAFCFGKSSPRLQQWLEKNRTFGPIITDWKANGVIAPRYKLISSVMMGAVFCASLISGVSTTVLAVQAIAILAGCTFVLSRPSRAVIPAIETERTI